MSVDLKVIEEEFNSKLSEISNTAQLADVKASFLGKNGSLAGVLKSLKELSVEDKKRIGQEANQLKEKFISLIEVKQQELEKTKILRELSSERIDKTFTDNIKYRGGPRSGGYHPISIVQERLEDIFLSMGFEVLDGPHIEDNYHNFEALNIPQDHPARDMQDTFWFKDNIHLLRTHTSAIQVRGMESHNPPFRFVAPGKVFRCEATDASHEAVFHQMEGMMIDKNLSVSNLIYFMKILLSEIFEREVDVRLRPGYFPFVEPGFELDIKCLICQGKGCSVCKRVGWVELLPCGMVHPNVLKYSGINPEEYNGFAFGLGLDRLAMMHYGVDDIRLFHSGNLKFLEQFSFYN